MPTPLPPSTAAAPRPWAGWRAGLAAACLGLGLASTGLAQGTPYTEVQRLVDAGQLGSALQQADRYLAERPRDPQMRFLKGVIESAQGRDDDAMATFNALTQDYPELPEPYNNLAVLHAKRLQLDQARAALELALRLNPRYATAQQNLGDVHGRLALQAYQEALRLNPNQAELRARLAALQAALSTPAPP